MELEPPTASVGPAHCDHFVTYYTGGGVLGHNGWRREAPEADYLIERLAKRMRLDESEGPECESEAHRDHYGAVNGLLGSLHAQRSSERERRRPATAAGPLAVGTPAPAEAVGRGDQVRWAGTEAAAASAGSCDIETWNSQTNFALSDVVDCGHGGRGRCLECAGRTVRNVPVAVYSTYCRAFQGILPMCHPKAEEAAAYPVPARSLVAGEINFASFAALLADIGVARNGERFLDLGSGVGRAVVAFALLLPGCSAAGVEIRPALHEVAASISTTRLPAEVRQRVSFHCGDMFACSWNEASVLLVNSTGFDDSLMERVMDKLQGVALGTRVVSLSQPLPCPGNAVSLAAAPSGFVHLLRARYRMSWGNATVFAYRRGSRGGA